MSAPPPAAWMIGSGIAWNYCRSVRNRVRVARGEPRKPTVSRWACQDKRLAVAVVTAGGSWLLYHFVTYVIDP